MGKIYGLVSVIVGVVVVFVIVGAAAAAAAVVVVVRCRYAIRINCKQSGSNNAMITLESK